MDSFTVIVIVFCVILCIDNIGALTSKKRRIGILESRVSILQLQHEGTVEEIARNAKSISQLNKTISGMDMCTVPINDRNSHSSTGFKEIRKDGNHESGRNLNIVRAFKQEKNQRMIYENQIHKALDEHKKEMNSAALNDKISLDKTMNNFSAILNELNFSLSEINKTTTDDIESLQIYIDNIESIVHDIKSTFDDLQNKLDESLKSLTLKHKEDMDSLKSSIEIQYKQDMDTFKKSIEMKLKQDISSIEIKQKQDMDTFKNSFEIKHTQDKDSSRSFIETLTTEQKNPKATVTMSCVDGGTRRGDFLYKYFSVRETHAGAREACAVCGGHIADLQDEDENKFVVGLVDKDYDFWLGATDTATEGTWIWDRTGEEAKYTNWASGQPDNYGYSAGVTAQCLFIGWGSPREKWGDFWCDYTLPYVCKYYLA